MMLNDVLGCEKIEKFRNIFMVFCGCVARFPHLNLESKFQIIA